MAETTPPIPPTPPSSLPLRDEEEATEKRTLRDYVIIVRERFWLAFPLALLLAVSLGYYKSREIPLYQSRATMQFEKPDKIVPLQGVTSPEVTSETDINTYIEVLRSGRLRTRVIQSFTPEELQLLKAPFVKARPPGSPPPGIEEAMSVPDVEAVRNSYLISISVTHRDPDAACLIANRYVDQFGQYLIEKVGGSNEYAVDWLKQRAEQMRKESEAASSKVQQFMQQHRLVSLDDSYNLIATRLQAVEAELTKVRLSRIELESQSAQIRSFVTKGQNLLEINTIASYDQVPTLKNQLADLLRERSILSERYLERHPKMIEIENRIVVVREQLEKAMQMAVAELKTRLEKTSDAEHSLEEEKRHQEQQFFNLRDLRSEYDSLKSQEAVAIKNYVDLLDRLNQTNTTKNLEKIPVHPLDRAVPAERPFTPNLGRIVRSSIGLGLVTFIAVALGLSFIDDRIKSTWDVENFIGATLLGIVPELGHSKEEDRYRMVLDNSQATGVESFLGVYSAIKIHSRLDFPKSLLVTSTIPGEGKTLVSCNLAGAFAKHGRRTLIIDCDLRRPMLHRHYRQANTSGLLTWYENGADLASDPVGNPYLGITKVGENLSLLCSGGRSKAPSELLESAAFAQLLERLKRRYELIVIDSPPMGVVTDPLLIADRADEVVYVCRFNKAFRKHIRTYIKALRSGKNDVLGIVLNGLSPRRIEYYSNYRYYRSYKKYYGAQT